MKAPSSNAILKADAISFVNEHPLLPRVALHGLCDYYNTEIRDPVACDTYGKAVSFKIAEKLGIEQNEAVMVCDYLWMCRLVDRFTLIGYYLYMILPAGEETLRDGDEIEFLYDPNIFPRHAYEEVLEYQRYNQQIFAMLHADGVEWGTREYWDRYWQWQEEKRYK